MTNNSSGCQIRCCRHALGLQDYAFFILSTERCQVLRGVEIVGQYKNTGAHIFHNYRTSGSDTHN